jgi:hypothetical protein
MKTLKLLVLAFAAVLLFGASGCSDDDYGSGNDAFTSDASAATDASTDAATTD